MTDLTAPPTQVRRRVRLEELAKRFPAAFGGDARPLKKGIHDDLMTRIGDADRRLLRRELGFHTSRRSYLEALAKGGIRINLEGVPAGDVTPEEQAAASTAIAQLKGEKAARHARADLLRQFEGSGLGMEAFLRRCPQGRDRACSELMVAMNERARQRAKEAELLAQLATSGLAPEAFAKQSSMSLEYVLKLIKKSQTSRAEE